jgi:signal transduction protein with GAF and PtsI domain
MPTTKIDPDSTSRLLDGLAEISRAVMERNYLDDILALIVSVTAKVTGSKICSILLLDKDKSELVLRASQSDSGQYNQKSNTPMGKGIAGRVALTNKPIRIIDVQKDPHFLNKEIARQDGLVSLLSVPMSVKGEVIGVINCYTPERYNFTEKDIHMLTTVASQAAVIIKNTELTVMKEVVEQELILRKNIERAKEILMEKRKITGQQAYTIMRKHSMNTRTSMAKIAESIILAANMD